MINQYNINEWLDVVRNFKVIDVRSPGEYDHARFPGAMSIPLLNNEERAIVGTVYKKEGNQAAVLKGYELVAHKFKDYILKAIEIAPEKEIGIYCWRGGLRSNIMAFLFHSAGFKVHLLKGGYKSFRTFVLQTLNQERKVAIIGGKTGSGKTKIIKELKNLNCQAIDLECLANHKGSAFGALGEEKQPSNEQFENFLALEWNNCSADKVVFLENESRLIGSVKIPDSIFKLMRDAKTFDIQIPIEYRVLNIKIDYGIFSKEELKACTAKLTRSFDNKRLQEIIDLLELDELDEWILSLLEYYDKKYEYGKSMRLPESIIPLTFEIFEPKQIAEKIKSLS